MSLLNCFAGGVFLGTCLLDLFPEVQENISLVMVKFNINSSFPVAEFLVAIGLFLVLIVEQISLECRTQTVESSQEERRPLVTEVPSENLSSSSVVVDNYGSIPINGESEGHSHIDFGDNKGNVANSALRSLLLLVALSLHSIFEGLAIGLQPDVEQLLSIFTAVVLHKCVIAFSLSLNLVQSKLNTCVIIQLTLVFCVAAPLGLAIGMGVMEFSDSLHATLISGILQGLACGTFIYITFFEVLPHELNSSDLRMPKLILILAGFASACLIVFLDPDSPKPVCTLSQDQSLK